MAPPRPGRTCCQFPTDLARHFYNSEQTYSRRCLKCKSGSGHSSGYWRVRILRRLVHTRYYANLATPPEHCSDHSDASGKPHTHTHTFGLQHAQPHFDHYTWPLVQPAKLKHSRHSISFAESAATQQQQHGAARQPTGISHAHKYFWSSLKMSALLA